MREQWPQPRAFPNVAVAERERRAARYERELIRHRQLENGLRYELAKDDALLFQKDKLIQRQRILSQESDHRLLNGLQMIVSLLTLQSRAANNPEVAAQLAAAADRAATVGRIHRRLHAFDGVETFALKQYLDDLCRDFSTMLSSACPVRTVGVTGIDISLPSATAVPLGFIANELITNAVKHGTGRIAVILETRPDAGYALSICNDGPGLPADFNPANRKGLGMKIIQALVRQIGGELRVGRGDGGQGARFTVLFSRTPLERRLVPVGS